LKERRFQAVVVESALGGKTAETFLANCLEHFPAMRRILLDTTALRQNQPTLIEELELSACFSEILDASSVRDLLLAGTEPQTEPSPNDPSPGTLELQFQKTPIFNARERITFLTHTSVTLTSMIEQPDLRLPTLPEIGQRLLPVLNSDQAGFDAIAALVEKEQSMSARLLQIANSPIYAGYERINNLTQAVARLGLRETRNILMTVIAEDLFKTPYRFFRGIMRTLWLHSVSTAYACEVIAQRIAIPETKDFFTLGLLHDIGKLLILHLLEIGRKDGRWNESDLDEFNVSQIMLMRHHDLGARLLEKWIYPPRLHEVVRLHNDTDGLSHHNEGVVVTYFANLLTRKFGYSLIPFEEKDFSLYAIASALNFTPATCEEIEREVCDLIARIKRSCLGQG
ncbi:MAG TPA: HDOD domain-containing protein, partial [Candidatus Sumerlaeota bacterium]|nr:HDOD domain-containing protein [Candidatus Sumerlaeota bacterium]